MYTAFTDQQVFQNPDVNVYCNAIYEELLATTTLRILVNNFAMTGTLAQIIDGAPLEELTVISFAFKDADLFEEVKKYNIGEKLGTSTINYPDRFQMILNEVYFEFLLKPAMVIKTVNGLQIENLTPPA